ncbi:MAG: hypothetical protein AWU59_1259 [Methanolobus sp. T82-4]|jgi:hypothetical protein|nr:MAG: hypothetical protein AWU59_1259 [Methanolobus sp. T82-4]
MISEILENWFRSLIDKIIENPIGNIAIIVVSIIIIKTMAGQLLVYGYLPVLSYLVACTYGFIRIIDNPYRPLVWAVGFIIGSEASKLFMNGVIPAIQEKTQVSIFSALIIFYVVIMLKLKSNELKKA